MSIVEQFGKAFVVTAELEPPRGPDTSDLLKQAREVAPFVSAVNITDAPMANLRLSSVVAAHLIERELGAETIFHFTCRDRNVIALQADLLGGAALGLRNVLTLTGDPPARGDHPEAKGVFEVDVLGLIKIIKTLNAGRSQGKDLSSPTAFNIAAAANPVAKDLELERSKVLAKLEAGANFFQTQPVFSLEDVKRFQDAFGGEMPAPVLYGILPLRSVKMAQRVSKWCRVPEALVKGLERDGAAAGLAWTRRLITELKESGAAGVHLYPLGKTKLLPKILPPDLIQRGAVAA